MQDKIGGFPSPLSYPAFQDYSSLKNIFADTAGWSTAFAQLRIDNKNPIRILFPIVTGNFFQVLGVKMHLGRSFSDDESSKRARQMSQYLDTTSGKNILMGIQMLLVQRFTLTEVHSQSLAFYQKISVAIQGSWDNRCTFAFFS